MALSVSSRNPRYFADSSGKIVYLVGSHTWDNFKDHGADNPPAAFNYTLFLDYLASWNHNFFRLWSWELPYSTQLDLAKWRHAPFPWPRSGGGTATDGGARFDLSTLDQSYFDRLSARVSEAAARGFYVSVMLWDGFGPYQETASDDGFPFLAANNVSSIDCGATESQSLSDSAVTTLQETYVAKVIDTVNGYDNVMYEIVNEASNTYSLTWQAHFIDYIHTYEAGKTKQHPVGMTSTYEGTNDATLLASDAEWISAAANTFASDGTKVSVHDTDHAYWWVTMKSDGTAAQQAWAWKSFCRGNNLLFMDPYLTPWASRNAPSGTAVDTYWNVLRIALGRTRLYADKLNLNFCVPHGELFSQGYGLANPAVANAQYLGYLPSGGSVTIDLSATPGDLSVEWFDPSTGDVSTGTPVSGGASRVVTAPFSGDAVVLLNSARRIVMHRL